MDPLTLGILGTGVISGIGNFFANKSANDRAEALQSQAMQEWMKLNIPDPESQKVFMQKFVSQGVIDPKFEKAIKQDPSAFEKVMTDSTQKAAQNRALGELEDIGYEGGLRLQDKAALQDSMLESQVRDRANREGIASEMSRRGLGGSGFEVASRLQGQQATGDREAANSLKVAAGAQDRALQSIMGAGDLATKYRGQDFNEQAQKASAADRINQFNTQNLRDVQSTNTGLANRAQEMNLANKQKIADQNTQLSNTEQAYNKSLIQQQFDNQAKRTAGSTGQANQIAGTEQRGGQMLGNTISNIGGAATGALANQANSNYWDDYFKKKNSGAGGGV